jgi:hypothetical protein
MLAIAEPLKSYNTLHSNPSSKMKTTDKYKAAVTSAIAFKHNHLNKNAIISA